MVKIIFPAALAAALAYVVHAALQALPTITQALHFAP
jgi:hypothetical protein